MDLSKLSDDDLMALRSGDLSRVSDAGLMALRGGAPQAAPRPKATDTGGTLQFATPFGRIDTGVGLSPGTTNFLAGMGKGFTDVARGVGQMARVVSRDDIRRARELDEELMQTGAGQVGNIVGTAASLAPLAFVPGANTYAGAAAIGAGSGLAAPSASTGETIANTAIGGAAGTAAQLAGRLIGAGYQGVKSLAAPFTERGQQQIAARTMQAFASDPAKASAALAAAQPSRIPGVQQTAAEIARDPGLAQLQRTIANNPDAGRALAQRAMQNQDARAAALESIAGTTAQRQAAVASREQLAQQAYQAATQASYTVDDQLASLLSRPAVRQAMARAKTLAENEGRQFSFVSGSPARPAQVSTVLDANGNPVVISPATPSTQKAQVTGQGLQDLKMAMDEMLSDPASGFTGKAGDAVRNLQKQLLSWMEGANPQFKVAREGYRAASQPINQMDVGRALLEKLQPASGAVGERGESFARALMNADDLARSATGWRGARFEQIMSPDQMATVNALRDQIAGVANAANLGRAVGSNTGQNFVSQNFLRQVLGPTGLPESWAESTLLESLMRPVQFAARAGEQRITPQIANALLDPQEAAYLLSLAQQRSMLERGGARALGALGPAGASVAPAMTQSLLPANQ
jgi:hypothetical protein